MPRPAPEKRQRKWAAKVRSGCLTCKKRRKKCDEQKPICQTCINGKYVCDGYETTQLHQDGYRPEDLLQNRSDEPAAASSTALVTIAPQSQVWKVNAYVNQSSSKDLYRAILLNGQLNATWAESDQRYAQFFVIKIAPILATTKQWHSFWSLIVPRISTNDVSIHHAMIALSAMYESKASGIDRKTKAISQVNLALRHTLSSPVSTINVLILCRLLASVSQSVDDWEGAMVHFQHGWKILNEAVEKNRIESDVAQLLAPTFLCASTDQIRLFNATDPTSSKVNNPATCLERIRLQLLEWLSSLDWANVSSSRKTFIQVAWAIISQTVCSLIRPGSSLASADNGSISVQEIKSTLLQAGALLDLDELQEQSQSVFQELAGCLTIQPENNTSWLLAKEHLQHIVDNFLVHAGEIKPSLVIGAYFHTDYSGPGCDIENYVRGQGIDHRVDVDFEDCSCTQSIYQSDASLKLSEGDLYDEERERERQKRAHYLEFICPYRSGLMPASFKNFN